MTHRKKVNDSLIDEKASWLKYEEKLDEKKSLWIVNSANADVLVTRASLWVSDKLADILSDWLDIIESGADGEILKALFSFDFSGTFWIQANLFLYEYLHNKYDAEDVVLQGQ